MKILSLMSVLSVLMLVSCTHTYERPENYQNPLVQIDTEVGSMTFELYEDKVPNAVSHFISLVESDFYKSMIFHGIVSDALIQGGCPNTRPNATGTMGQGNAGYFIAEEIHPDLTHNQPGILSLARSHNPNSTSSQFVIMLEKMPVMDGNHTVIGKIIEGQKVLEILGDSGTAKGQIKQEIEFNIKLIRKNDIDYQFEKI
ncbi:MAG: peptidylprolyl isomerase [Lentisphaerales bacterium]|nr:peptidylprolyl isomerase [Lentisphaerales bacterium]